jgi:chromosome segregation ATPase
MFTESINKAGAEAQQALKNVADALNQMRLGADVQELKKDIAGMGAALGGISARLKTFDKAISTVEEGFSGASSAAQNLTGDVNKLSREFTGVIGTAEAAFSSTTQAATSLTGRLNDIATRADHIARIAEQLTKLQQSFEAAASGTNSLNKGVTEVTAAFARLTQDIEKSVSQMSDSLDKSATVSTQAVDRLTKDLSKLVDFIITESQKKQAA